MEKRLYATVVDEVAWRTDSEAIARIDSLHRNMKGLFQFWASNHPLREPALFIFKNPPWQRSAFDVRHNTSSSVQPVPSYYATWQAQRRTQASPLGGGTHHFRCRRVNHDGFFPIRIGYFEKCRLLKYFKFRKTGYNITVEYFLNPII